MAQNELEQDRIAQSTGQYFPKAIKVIINRKKFLSIETNSAIRHSRSSKAQKTSYLIKLIRQARATRK